MDEGSTMDQASAMLGGGGLLLACAVDVQFDCLVC